MKPDVSILIPSIRTNRWPALLESIEKAGPSITWEVVFIGPFKDDVILAKYPDKVKHVLEHGSPSRAIQRGMLFLESDLVFLTVDDCTLFPDSLDISVSQYHSECSYDDVLLMRYKEGSYIYTPGDYRAGHHDALRIPNVDGNWMIAPQFIMDKNKFIQLGGFDCVYEYNNEAVHDFMFRLQKLGGKVVASSTHCCEATHYPDTTADHAPIHNAQLGHDYPIFRDRYARGDFPEVKYDNWQDAPEVWQRRFSKGMVNTYEELIKSEGYHF